MKNAAHKIQAYLSEVLGAPAAKVRPWPGATSLPFFLADGFDLVELSLFGHLVVIAVDKKPGALSPSELSARMQKLRAKTALVLYATERLSYHQRRALIEQKVPFVVPGNQLYLPDLGIDLREYIRRGAGDEPAVTLTPSAQAMLICSLLAKPWSQVLHPATIARELDYTVMTASRAASNLVAAGLAVSGNKPQAGRPLYLTFRASSPADVWRAAEPILRSPVTRTVWIDRLPEGLNVRVAGAAALARHTMLVPPNHPVYAVKRGEWLAARDAEPALGDLGKDARRIELQIWSYSPHLEGGDEVDPFSVIASLREDADERVQLALNELQKDLPW
jgi:hypothetical protein